MHGDGILILLENCREYILFSSTTNKIPSDSFLAQRNFLIRLLSMTHNVSHFGVTVRGLRSGAAFVDRSYV